jgi:SAM-dependent methyltransferase
MLEKIKSIIKKEEFEPTLLGLFINPYYFARKGLIENINLTSEYIKGKTLDIGCGKKPYEKKFNSTTYIGLEIDSSENRLNKKADVFYNGDVFPFKDNEFDSIVINQVFEHVFNTDKFLQETNRILKINGFLLITVPFIWEEHEKPYDCCRYSSFGLEYFLKKYGFEIIIKKKTINDIRLIFQLLICYIHKKITTRNKFLNLLLINIFIAPFNIIGEVLSKILWKDNDLYLDNLILAKKVENA